MYIMLYDIMHPERFSSFIYIYIMVSTYWKNGRWQYLLFIYWLLLLFFFFCRPQVQEILTFLVLLFVWYIYVCDLENDRILKILI